MIFGTSIFGGLARRYKEYKSNDDDYEDQQLIIDKEIPELEGNIPLSK